MESLRQIRSRIKSVASTQSITRAMQLVAASKLKRAQGRLVQFRETYRHLGRIIGRLVTSEPPIRHPLLGHDMTGEVRRAPMRLILVASDAGLCGAYNLNILRAAEQWLGGQEGPVEVLAVGRRGVRYAQRRGWTLSGGPVELLGRVQLPRIHALAAEVTQAFLNGESSRVMIAYTHFNTLSSWKPMAVQLLPIQPPEASREAIDYIYEPSKEAIFEEILPLWVRTQLAMLIIEALTSEHAARMIAMKNATDNASEIIDALTLRRNKIRQASITKEISEIVGTAEALK